jgi:hypothetical protein
VADLPARIAKKIEVEDECWRWLGARTGHGYGNATWDGRQIGAHRLVYELLVAPIAKGLQIDHLCRNKLCVNPAHLEPVTPAENTRRVPSWPNAMKTHCPHGHPYDEANTLVYANGRRHCRACNREAVRRYRMRRPR